MSVIKHTPEEAWALFEARDRADVVAMSWLLESGVPEGFVGPVCRFDERSFIWTETLFWRGTGCDVVARVNDRGEMMLGTNYRTSDGGERASRLWFTDREEWRSNLLDSCERMSEITRIQSEALEGEAR